MLVTLVMVITPLLRADPAVATDEPPPVPAATAGKVGMRALLQEAIRKSALDAERWAYTQTVVNRDRDGKVKNETVVRFDPSQPFERQWRPLRIDGQEPTERQIEQLLADHEKRRKNRRALGELLDIGKATVVEENATTITYEVPLIKDDNQQLPPDKFRVTARVNKGRQAFENVAVRLREAFRMALVVNLKSGEADMDFASVDPQYAPPITALRVDGEGSILFFKVGGAYSAIRTDFKRVTPYSERLKVKLAPLKFLDY